MSANSIHSPDRFLLFPELSAATDFSLLSPPVFPGGIPTDAAGVPAALPRPLPFPAGRSTLTLVTSGILLAKFDFHIDRRVCDSRVRKITCLDVQLIASRDNSVRSVN